MKEFRGLLEQRAEEGPTAVSAAATWSAIERALADEPAFVACPAPARLRVWLQVLKQLVEEEHAAWDAEDRARLRKERKRTPPLVQPPPPPLPYRPPHHGCCTHAAKSASAPGRQAGIRIAKTQFCRESAC